MQLKNLINTGLGRYYNALSSTGYIKDKDTISLLVLIFLQDFIDRYEGYITNEDMNKINKLLDCISNSCLIPRIEHMPASHPIDNYFNESNVRFTEDDSSRVSTEDIIRTDAKGE